MALLIMDLDRFKEINDALGHAVGDQLLQEAANRLKVNVRECDTLVRLGGDEFAALLNGLERDDGVAAAADRMANAISRPAIGIWVPLSPEG